MAAKISDYVDLGLYNLHRDIRATVDKAVKEGWTAQRFENELRNTSWYKQRTEAQRQWDALLASQPKEAERRQTEMRTKIGDAATAMGLTLSTKDRDYISEQILKFGLSEDEAQNWLAAKYTYTPGVQYGSAAEVEDAFRQFEFDYGVSITDQTRTDLTRKVLAGEYKPQQFSDYMIEMAKKEYPTIAGALDQGVTVREYFSPYIQTAVKELGIPEGEIDISDMKWKSALSQPTGVGGTREPMTLDEWRRHVRTDEQYGWKYTDGARQQASATAMNIMSMFGAR